MLVIGDRGSEQDAERKHPRVEETRPSTAEQLCIILSGTGMQEKENSMSQKKVGMEAVEGLVKIEETLSEIYRLFSERFAAHREMWSRMAEEEKSHAKWIRDLYGKVEEGSVRVGEDHFRVQGIEAFLDFANKRLEEAQTSKLPFLHALDMALDLESGLLEREFFKIFEADSKTMEQAFEEMQQKIRDHTERIRKTLVQEGGLS